MARQIISKAVGIDLGTTNSAVAMMNPTDTEIIIHRDRNMKRETTPSCVWKNPDTGEIVVGHKAFRRVGFMPPPVRSIKRSMGEQIRVCLTDEEKTPEEISAHILAEMKRQIEEDLREMNTDSTEWIVDRAIVTVPAYFGQDQVEATRKAAELAGLTVVDLLAEPTAAACYHCWRTDTHDGTFLVYDLGGGTFDVTVLRCTAGAFEVLGISGNSRLGGDDIDTVVAEHLRQRLLREDYALELDLQENPEDRLLFDKLTFLAESVKKALATSGEFYLRDTSLRDKEGTPVVIDTILERPQIDELARPIVERTIPYCREALEMARKKAGVTLPDIDEIILAGGSTHMPLVREMVQEALCARPDLEEPRARCNEPIYEKVDTLVALGAAVRAAAVGGLAVYDPAQTVRVSFRGTGATGSRETHVGGNVEALDEALDLTDGRVRLTIADLGFEDVSDLSAEGAFGFRRVPLQPSAENQLAFEVYDRSGASVATVGRAVEQSQAAQRPTGGSMSTATLAKPLTLEVKKEGRLFRRELMPALTTLPADGSYGFLHPGETDVVRLPLYQHKRKIKEIRVPVGSSLPRGTPVEMDVHIDKLSFITVKGTVGGVDFEAAVEPPPPRETPTEKDLQKLKREFDEALQYLPAGPKGVAMARFQSAEESYRAAAGRGNTEQAVHEFEEMEEIVASNSRPEGALEPPKEFLDELVKECQELNSLAASTAAQAGMPHDPMELAKAIEAQRQWGEQAFKEADQKRYSDALMMLENLKNHLIGLYQKVHQATDTRTVEEKTRAAMEGAQAQAEKVEGLAQAASHADLEREAKEIQGELRSLAREAQKNPEGVREKVSRLVSRLHQIKNQIMGAAQPQDETTGLVLDQGDQVGRVGGAVSTTENAGKTQDAADGAVAPAQRSSEVDRLSGMENRSKESHDTEDPAGSPGASSHGPSDRALTTKTIEGVLKYLRRKRGPGKAGSPETGGQEHAQPEVPGGVVDVVNFSVTSPGVVARGTGFIVDIWAHLPEQRPEVLQRAREASEAGRIQLKTKGPAQVSRGTIITVRLRVADLVVDDPEETILWVGDIGNADFTVTVPEDAREALHPARATFHVNGLQIARLRFPVRVGRTTTETEALPGEQFRYHSAFASYSSEDRNQVLARIQGMQKAAPGLDVFMDVLSLRSGQDFEQQIQKVIPEKDVFYLFWSENARKSEWVEKEWRCAYDTRGAEFIDPVPLVDPEDVPPPPELAHRHFHDWPLAFMSNRR